MNAMVRAEPTDAKSLEVHSYLSSGQGPKYLGHLLSFQAHQQEAKLEQSSWKSNWHSNMVLGITSDSSTHCITTPATQYYF